MSERDPKSVMWAEALAFIERAERLRRNFFHPGGGRSRAPSWEPPVDIYEMGGALRIIVALPGVNPERVEAVIDQGVLIVGGHRPLPTGPGTAEVYRMELPHGYFERRVGLPPGEYELHDQQMVDGCLELTLQRLA